MAFPLSTSTLAFATAVVLGLGFALYRAALPRPIPGVPHNKQSARLVLGDGPDFLAYQKKEGDLFGMMPRRLKELNSAIAQVFLRPFARPFVILSDPQETNDILTRRTKEFDRSKFFGDLFEPLMPGHHIHLKTGPQWSAHRRLINDTMSPSFLHEVAGPLFWSTTQDLVKLWREKVRLAEGHPIPAAQDLYCTALEVVWHATFGFETGSVKAQVKLLSGQKGSSLPSSLDSPVSLPEAKNPDAFDSIMTLSESLAIPVGSLFPKLHYGFALRFWPSLISSTKHKDRLIHERLQIAKKKFSTLNTDDTKGNEHFTSALDLVIHHETIMAEKEGRKPIYDSRVVYDELFGFLLAGHETTSTTLCWGLKFLTADQTVQRKLREALQASHTTAYKSQEQPSTADITSTNIPYLEAVMAEILRKASTASAVVRTAVVDTVILGYHIPKGTDVFLMQNGPGTLSTAIPVDDTLRSKSSRQTKDKHPGWDPETIGDFVPERWLRKDQSGNDEFDPLAGPSAPFGIGQRGCFGRKWAQLELKVILTLIVWNFELQPTPADLSSFRAVDKITHQPTQCYVRLAEVESVTGA